MPRFDIFSRRKSYPWSRSRSATAEKASIELDETTLRPHPSFEIQKIGPWGTLSLDDARRWTRINSDGAHYSRVEARHKITGDPDCGLTGRRLLPQRLQTVEGEQGQVADGRTERFVITGKNIRLPPNVTLALGIAFHELATNL